MTPIISESKLLNTEIPLVIIDAGGIAKDSYLPAYKKAVFEILGIYDINVEKSKQSSEQFGIKTVCQTI